MPTTKLNTELSKIYDVSTTVICNLQMRKLTLWDVKYKKEDRAIRVEEGFEIIPFYLQSLNCQPWVTMVQFQF